VAHAQVIVVSDTHLSPAAPEADANWDAVVRYVDEVEPDLVIHAGDLSLDGAHRSDDLHHSRRQLDRLSTPWHAVPGNHDIGDNPWPGTPDGYTVTTERHERWLDIVGPDHWSIELNGWTLVAINAQLLGSGLDAEATQWTWIGEQLRAGDGDGSVALVTHKPLAAGDDAELASAPPYRYVPPADRRRLAALSGAEHVGLVISGHVHQYRLIDHPKVRHVWAPTTWAVLPDEIQTTVGAKRCGLVSFRLDGDRPVQPQLIEPPGLTQLTLLRDIPSPYDH